MPCECSRSLANAPCSGEATCSPRPRQRSARRPRTTWADVEIWRRPPSAARSQPGDESAKSDAAALAHMLKLDDVEPSFAALVLAHERLRLAELFCQVDLTKTRLRANLAQQVLEPRLAAGIERLVHRPATYAWLRCMPISDMVARKAWSALCTQLLSQSTCLAGQRAPGRAARCSNGWQQVQGRRADRVLHPADVGTYYEAFLGSGSVLATVAPAKAVGADSFAPLVEIWQAVKTNPRLVKAWYEDRWAYAMAGDKRERYEEIKASYNTTANAADFLFLSRSCYAGIVRFRKRDGYMSTPVGAHRPIAPRTFAERVDEWSRRIQGTEFLHADYAEVMDRAVAGDFVYCDPPYSHSQSILYGAQDFDLAHLFSVIASCKSRGVRVALSIDGTKSLAQETARFPCQTGCLSKSSPSTWGDRCFDGSR